MIALVSVLLTLLATQGSGSFSFDFPIIGPNTEGIFLERDASQSLAGLELTKNEVDRKIGYSSGRASYDGPVQLWDPKTQRLADFTTHFAFAINAVDNDNRHTGDGMTFFLAPLDSPMANHSQGGNLGLISDDFTAANRSHNGSFVAVEFDTFRNPFDPSSQHVGIDVGSVVSVVNATWTDGNMTDGRTANSWVRYDSASHNLTVFLTYDQKPVFREEYCVLWYQLDLRAHLPERVRVGFTASTGLHVETHTVLSWSFNSTLEVIQNQGSSGNTGLAVGLGVGLGCAVVCLVGMYLWSVRARKRNDAEESEEEYDPAIDGEFEREAGPKRFTYSELRIATRDFSEEGKLGEGGFGGVYKGSFGGEQFVAVKRISKASRQGLKEYISEVKIISRLRHRNLVQLIGWCHKKGEFLLVYEYLPNRSLDSHLFPGGEFTTPLPWAARQKIALGLASSLLYLHEEWEQCVVHRDVKSSNVMLDANFNAKLGDFGLARLVDHEFSLHTVAFAGTMGYIAPECVETGKSSKESDVYSFGVVALEICCGRRSVVASADEPSKVKLVNWVWELYGKGQILEAADERLGSEFDADEILCLMIVGLWCCHPDPNSRPSMKQVMNVLNFEAPLPNNLPRELPRPMYCVSSFNINLDSYSSSAFTASSVANSSPFGSPSKPLIKLEEYC